MRLKILTNAVLVDLGRWAAGALLVSSATLKGFLPDYASPEFFSVGNPLAYSALIFYELLLGLVLLTDSFRSVATRLALGTFVVFSIHNAYYVVTGRHSCGCAGTVSISPAVMLALDTLTVVLVAAGLRRDPGSIGVRPARLVGVASVVALFWWTASDSGQSREFMAAALSVHAVYASPARADLGRHSWGDVVECQLTVTNRTRVPVRVVGVSDSRLLAIGNDLPMTIPNGNSGSFRVNMLVRGNEGRNAKPVIIYCDDGQTLTPVTAYLTWVVSAP